MPRMFSGSSISDWVLEVTGNLFEISLEKKLTIIKSAAFATNKCLVDSDNQNLEVLMTEISDGRYYLPALIDPERLRYELGLDKGAKLNCHDLPGKVLEIKAYMVAAYRVDKVCYPYIVILDLKFKEKAPIHSVGSSLEDVCQHAKVKEWIAALTASLPDTSATVSLSFNPEEIRKKCLDIQIYEPIIDMMMSILYKDRIVTLPTVSTGTEKKSSDLSLNDTRKRVSLQTHSQTTPKKVKIDERASPQLYPASNSIDIPDDFDEQCQRSIQAEFDAMTFIPDEHMLPYSATAPVQPTVPAQPKAPLITDSSSSSFNMDIDIVSMENVRLPSPPCSSPLPRMEVEALTVATKVSSQSTLVKSLHTPSKYLTARQRRLAFEKIRKESLLEFLRI